MKLTLTQLKRITDLKLMPKEYPVVRVPFFPIDDPRFNQPYGSTAITPYIVELVWNSEIKDWETNLEL